VLVTAPWARVQSHDAAPRSLRGRLQVQEADKVRRGRVGFRRGRGHGVRRAAQATRDRACGEEVCQGEREAGGRRKAVQGEEVLPSRLHAVEDEFAQPKKERGTGKATLMYDKAPRSSSRRLISSRRRSRVSKLQMDGREEVALGTSKTDYLSRPQLGNPPSSVVLLPILVFSLFFRDRRITHIGNPDVLGQFLSRSGASQCSNSS